MGEHAHRVSVVIPVYKVERYLEQCLASIRSELGGALQVIIVNDGSPDGSRDIAERFIAAHPAGAQDPQIPDFQLLDKPNGGYGSAVNFGIARADGDYIGIVESDDYLDGDLFGNLERIARESGGPDVVKSTYWRVWMPDTPKQRVWHSLLRHRGVPTWEEGAIDLGQAPQLVRYHPSVWSAIYRRDFLEATGTRFLDEPGAGWVDNPFNMRALCQARSIAYTDDAWYCYREDRPGSSSVQLDPELPLVRWQQMAAEVAQSRWADDEGLLAVLYTIAFQHLGHLWDTPAYEQVRPLAEDILRSLDPDIALGLEEVSSRDKQRYLDAIGSGRTAPGDGAHRAYLVREAAHSLRENGPGFLLARLRGSKEAA